MKSMFLGRLRAVSLSNIALALGLAGATAPAPAFAAPVITYTCVAEVSTGFAPAYSPGPSGGAVLATQTFSGPTLQSVVGQCHQFTRNAFAANTAWSDPIKFCQRYALANYEQTAGNNSKTRLVWVSNYFQQMGKPNGVNRVGPRRIRWPSACQWEAHQADHRRRHAATSSAPIWRPQALADREIHSRRV